MLRLSRARGTAAVLAAAAAGSALAAACGTAPPAGSAPAARSSAAGSAPSDSSAQAARKAAVAAYAGMWHAMQAAGASADAAYPGLTRYASGQALATLRDGLRAARRQGIVLKGAPVIHPAAGAVTPARSPGPGQVIITDCLDDTHWLNYVAATGKLQDNVPGGHRLVMAAVTRAAGGRWTVSRLAVQGEGTCS